MLAKPYDPSGAFVAEVAARFGTPCYLYDTSHILENVATFRRLVSHPRCLLYPLMTNDNPHLVRLIHDQGVPLFVSSPVHLDQLLDQGIEPSAITFTSRNCSPELIGRIAELGLQFNANTVSQARAFLELGGEGVGLRLQLESLLARHAAGKAPATDLAAIGETLEILERAFADGRLARRKVTGLHIYPGTAVEDAAYLVDCYEALVSWSAEFPNLAYLDLGGGFPLDESFDWDRLAGSITRLAGDSGQARLRLEPGRVIMAGSAIFITRVTDVFSRGDRHYLGVDGSVNIFPRPLFYGTDKAHHPVSLVRDGGHPEADRSYTVCGMTTYSGDVLARDVKLPAARVGDHLVFHYAGAYCASMRTEFLGSYPPTELKMADGEIEDVTRPPLMRSDRDRAELSARVSGSEK